MKKADRKTSTFIYRGLGIPIKLVGAPMKKAFGEWCLDIDMNKLMRIVLEAIIHKPTALTGDELRYIRKYLEMATTEFGKTFGVSHVAILKWEKGENQVSPAMEVCIRLYILNHLHAKDKEFRALYNDLDLQRLSKGSKGKIYSIAVNAATEELKIAL
jgi:DNA-binding transcriptional regulator YiaG